jgi:hypothetical protein
MTNRVKALMANGVPIEQILSNPTMTTSTTMDLVKTSPVAASLPFFTQPSNEPEFSINERFGFVEKLVGMVASGVQQSAVITGRGGLGKTYTVSKALSAGGYTDISGCDTMEIDPEFNAFRVVKGYSSPRGLYRTLYENNNGVIVFDDCDSVLENPASLNVLKAALDSYDQRIVTWNVEAKGDDLPTSFEFTGGIIFISNKAQNEIDQAIRSRSMLVDLTMTPDEMVERMCYIASQPSFMPEFGDDEKMDALEFLSENRDKIKDMSLRSLITVTKIRAANTDWRDLAIYMTQ